MEKISVMNERIKAARDNHERDYERQIAKLVSKENCLQGRLDELRKKKSKTAQAHGNEDASDGDLVEVNAGGEIIAAKRSTLTQLKGTRIEAVFSGRWEKMLQRDNKGRIFLDVNSAVFRAIIDYLSEMAISSKDDPANPPSVDGELYHVLRQQLELFGISDHVPMVNTEIERPCMVDTEIERPGMVKTEIERPGMNIIKKACSSIQLHEWLKEDGSDGMFRILYRGSRDGMSSDAFHSKCDNQGPTLTVIKMSSGIVVGGYSNTSWTSDKEFHTANKAFLFVLSGNNACKMKLKDSNDYSAVWHLPQYGPVFGGAFDLQVRENQLTLYMGNSYKTAPLREVSGVITCTIGDIEVFQVSGETPMEPIAAKRKNSNTRKTLKEKPVKRFSEDVNKAINSKQEFLHEAESEILLREKSFKDEQHFISTFACGETKDVITLNVSGSMMTTKRSTLINAEDSVLARQFDDSKWTEKGCNNPRVEEWTPSDVSSWIESIAAIPGDVGSVFIESGITGRELLALNMEGLKMIGVNRPGTLCLLAEEIQLLKQASLDVATLIEHSPYCFDKIIEYLRSKQLHSQGLADEPSLPVVCESQKGRYEKVVKYYFPGDSAKFILG